MTHIYLVRHGENRANLTKEFSHRKVDYSLTEKGRLQAQQTAAFFRDKEIDAVYSSPLRRARETAEIIAAPIGLPVTVRENFREVNVGVLEDEPPTAENWALHDEICQGWIEGRREVSFPGGENYHDLWGRVKAGLLDVVRTHPDGTVIVVGHGGIFAAALLALSTQDQFNARRQIENHNCSISEVIASIADGKFRGEFVRWAFCDHMHGNAAEFVSGSPAAAFYQSDAEEPSS